MSETTPAFLDADPTTLLPKMGASELRFPLEIVQEGVFDTNDLSVSAGAGLSVDVATGRAVVDSTFVLTQPGRRYGIYNDATVNSASFESGGIPSNGSGNPRLDVVVARVYDHTYTGDTNQRKWRLQYIAGTASSSAALGGTLPGGIPSTSLLLAEVLVPAGNPATIPAANIRDRRTWARGGYTKIVRTSGNYTVTSQSAPGTLIDATNLQPRIECSGAPVRVLLAGDLQVNATDGYMAIQFFLDGAPIETNGPTFYHTPGPVNRAERLNAFWDLVPSAGSHLIGPAAYLGGGATSGAVKASTPDPLQFVVQEFARQSPNNF